MEPWTLDAAPSNGGYVGTGEPDGTEVPVPTGPTGEYVGLGVSTGAGVEVGPQMVTVTVTVPDPSPPAGYEVGTPSGDEVG